MPDLPSIAPPVAARATVLPSRRTMMSPLWRGVRSAGIACPGATAARCRALLSTARHDAPIVIDDDVATINRTRLHIIADLTPAGDRPAIALTIRPSMVMDDAQGEWVGRPMTADHAESFEALVERALDRALPWRSARPDIYITGEYQ